MKLHDKLVEVYRLLIHNDYAELDEITAPGPPDANKLRLYVKDGPNTATGGAASVLATVDANGTEKIIDSGFYTPTLFNTTNVAASTTFEGAWSRIGNVVTVSGKLGIDPTAAAVTVLGISLPVPSNFAADSDCNGVASMATESAFIDGDVANDHALLTFIAVGTANAEWHFVFQYKVI